MKQLPAGRRVKMKKTSPAVLAGPQAVPLAPVLPPSRGTHPACRDAPLKPSSSAPLHPMQPWSRQVGGCIPPPSSPFPKGMHSTCWHVGAASRSSCTSARAAHAAAAGPTTCRPAASGRRIFSARLAAQRPASRRCSVVGPGAARLAAATNPGGQPGAAGLLTARLQSGSKGGGLRCPQGCAQPCAATLLARPCSSRLL